MTALIRTTHFPFPVEAVDPPPSVRPKELPDWLTTPIANRHLADMQNFQTWLEQLRLDDLRGLGQQRGWSLKGTRKADLARQVAEHMVRPEEVQRALGQVGADQRRVLTALGLIGGFPGQQMADVERIVAGGGVFRRANQVVDMALDLANLGLIIYNQPDTYNNSPLSFIPRAVARSMPPLLADRLAHNPELPAFKAGVDLHIATPSVFVSSVLQLLIALEENPPVLTPPMPRPRNDKYLNVVRNWDYDPAELLKQDEQRRLGAPGAALSVPPPAYPFPATTMTRLTALISDETKLEFMYYLLVGIGVLQPGSPIEAWPEVKEAFLRQGEPALRAIMARVYFRLANWTELWLLQRGNPALKLMRNPLGYGYNQPSAATMLGELAVFRRLTLQALAWLPENEWISLDDFLDLMQRVWPLFTSGFWISYYRVEPQQSHWFLSLNDKPIGKDHHEGWAVAQAMYIRKMLTGPLHWLGLVDYTSRQGVTTDFRVHGLADLFWDRSETATDPYPVSQEGAAPQKIAVQVKNDVILVNPSQLGAAGHRLMDRIAKLEKAQPYQFEFRLDIGVAHRSFEAGASLAEFETEWETALGSPMPKGVRDRLAGWWNTYGRVRVYRDVTIIEFGDDYALAEMKAATSLEKLMIAEISSRLVVIPKDAVQRLTTELEKAGYTPRHTAHD